MSDQISVCICTFKRPASLERLLKALAGQVRIEGVSFDIVVVDNDSKQSAQDVVREFRARHGLCVSYTCEPEQNIALARNRAVREARGDLLAFIDDDEWPVAEWMAHLYSTFRQADVDGVLGPVVPHYPNEAPLWLRQSGIGQRRRLATGTALSARDCRTGNVLLKRSLFTEGFWFDPALGRTGGEDGDFFRRQLGDGRRFIWCDDAAVFEAVPPERWTTSFHIKRYLRSGTITGELIRAGRVASGAEVAKNLVLLAGCSLAAPIALLLPTEYRVQFFQKAAYCCGIVTGYAGLSILRLRD